MNWKDIKGYEGIYQVSDDGHVKRIYKTKKPKILKNRPSANYYTVSLSHKCNKKTYAVHRLVAEAFLVKPEGATEVNHLDGNKLNNNVENLEWVTQKQNRDHAMRVLNRNPFGKAPKKVKCIDPETNDVVAEYNSISEAARSVGNYNARSPIIWVCQGYQKTAYGFRWEYAD